jgi:hypothetical protein
VTGTQGAGAGSMILGIALLVVIAAVIIVPALLLARRHAHSLKCEYAG